MGFEIRKAMKEDSQTLLDFIRHLAVYEHLEHEMVATKKDIEKHLFENGYAEALILEFDEKPIGICIYFYTFSTFYCKPALYLEDLFILEEYRGNGYGKKALERLNEIALEKECTRFEWSCLDWNEPSIEFYKRMGAEPMKDWIRFRLTEDVMKKL